MLFRVQDSPDPFRPAQVSYVSSTTNNEVTLTRTLYRKQCTAPRGHHANKTSILQTEGPRISTTTRLIKGNVGITQAAPDFEET